MAAQTTAQLLELFSFLQDPQAPVRRIALASLLPYTIPDAPERKLFLRDAHIEQLATMCADQELIAHDALSALINLSSTLEVVTRLHKLPGFVTGLVRMIIDEKALLSDLACMLLSNMSKLDAVSRQILGLRVPFSLVEDAPAADAPSATAGAGDADASTAAAPRGPTLQASTEEIAALDLLLEVFLKGEGKKYNPNANYDFLASVFANVSLLPAGRAFLLSTPDRSIEPPLAKIISFTEHPSTIRRGGVASTIKNAAFEKAGHTRLVASSNEGPAEEGCIDLLVQLLLPLCGNEEFDLDVMDELPGELQLLPASKQREPDAQIRLILVETLVLLATARPNRDAMRARGVYPVIKEAHLKEAVPGVKEAMVRLVNLLMREEGPDTAVSELDASTAPEDLPPAPQWNANPETGFVSAAGVQVDGPSEEAEPAQEGAPALAAGDDQPFEHNNVPLSRMQPEEDEDEMLLEV
ncbi:hypothetical protein Rhopal_005130-T1 [Rhodotorula paludigena]|uniref:Protein HGH1 homolog n=1 Tax=Rhodotorula paludigena TaxID=86838 RepID=A0AAV5GHH5_9BASI|nr:hypothetical protein Rhopal_005130-T1 [Rhodotorula paludigena]